MENTIELKQIRRSRNLNVLKYIKAFARKFFEHYGHFWNSQVDYEQVDQKIQEIRLKYECYRMRL